LYSSGISDYQSTKDLILIKYMEKFKSSRNHKNIEKNNFSDQHNDSDLNLNIYNLIKSFIILSLGLLISSVIFFNEIIWKFVKIFLIKT
jgi:hypothetical protein